MYYTYGKYDGMLIVEAPIDETVMSALLPVGSQGNVDQDSQAFTEFEATKIIEQLRASLIVSILKRKMLIIILCR